MAPVISLLVPTMESPENAAFMEQLMWSVSVTAGDDVEVCVGCYGKFPDVSPRGVRMSVIERDEDPGLGRGTNDAFDASQGEWVVMANDDIVCLPGWSNIADKLAKDRVMAWDLIEPNFGSFPPPCDAGRLPGEFDWGKASKEALRRRRPHEAGDFFGLTVCHRDVYGAVRIAEDIGAYSCHDIDFHYRIFKKFPRMLFGRLGASIYHFQRGTIGRRPELGVDGKEVWDGFIARHGVTIQEAYDALKSRTLAQIAKDPRRWR